MLRVLTARAIHSELRTAFATVGDLFGPGPRGDAAAAGAGAAAGARGRVPAPGAGRAAAGRHDCSRRRCSRSCGCSPRRRPLLVAIDDAQWVDASSVEILRFVLRRLEAEPVGVLATVRGRPVAAPLGSTAPSRVFAGCRSIPLSVGAIHRLLWGRLSLNLARPVLVRVHEAVGREPVLRARGRARAGRRHDPCRRRPRPSAREPSRPRRGARERAADGGA